MGIVDNAKEIADLIKKIGDIDLYRKIVELEGEVIEITRSKRELEEQVVHLMSALEYKEKLAFREGFYWLEGDKEPFCPGCWEAKRIPVHVVWGIVKEMGLRFQCPNCKVMYRNRHV